MNHKLHKKTFNKCYWRLLCFNGNLIDDSDGAEQRKRKGQNDAFAERRCCALGGAEIQCSFTRDWQTWQWLTCVHGNHAANLTSPIEYRQQGLNVLLFLLQKTLWHQFFMLTRNQRRDFAVRAARACRMASLLSLFFETAVKFWYFLFVWILQRHWTKIRTTQTGGNTKRQERRRERLESGRIDKSPCSSCLFWISAPSRSRGSARR